jgi:hypothetical protein
MQVTSPALVLLEDIDSTPVDARPHVFKLLSEACAVASESTIVTTAKATQLADLVWQATAKDSAAAMAWLYWGDSELRGTAGWLPVAQAVLGCVLQSSFVKEVVIGMLLAHIGGGGTAVTHPGRSASLLENEGASDTMLEVVLCHHELADGSGYPFGLAGEAIPPAARLGSILHELAVLISSGCPATECLRQVYQATTKFDKNTTVRYIKEIGIYPAGTLVRLTDSSIGVVVRHQKGQYLVAPLQREPACVRPGGALIAQAEIRGAVSVTVPVLGVSALWLEDTNN